MEESSQGNSTGDVPKRTYNPGNRRRRTASRILPPHEGEPVIAITTTKAPAPLADGGYDSLHALRAIARAESAAGSHSFLQEKIGGGVEQNIDELRLEVIKLSWMLHHMTGGDDLLRRYLEKKWLEVKNVHNIK